MAYLLGATTVAAETTELGLSSQSHTFEESDRYQAMQDIITSLGCKISLSRGEKRLLSKTVDKLKIARL